MTAGEDGPVAPGWQVDEATRAALLASYDAHTLQDDPALTRITNFAAALCTAPVALVSLVDEGHQTFIARFGLTLAGTPREQSLCGHAMTGDGIMVVPDALADPRFADNDLVTGAVGLRFYAGAPLVGDDAMPLGALCIIDTVPRPEGLTPLQRQGLLTLAALVADRLRGHRARSRRRDREATAARRLDDSEQRFRTLADTMPQMVWSTLPDGFHDYYNARWYEFTGVPEGSTDGEAWNGMFHPDDQERAWSVWRHSLETGDPYVIEYRLRHRDGTYRWVLGRALPLRDGGGTITRWFGTCTDIHAQKLAAEERELVSQELSHRIKNIFSVIAGLLGFAARGRPELAPFVVDLRDRITALGRAHDFVRPHSAQSRPTSEPDSLHGLLDALFEPYRGATGGVRIAGDDVMIDDRSATPLALLFHELATNATKYGALSTPGGHIDLTFAAGESTLVLEWRERGGPPIADTPAREGFGSRVVEMAAVRQLGGTIGRRWLADGVEIDIVVPTAALRRQPMAAPATRSPTA